MCKIDCITSVIMTSPTTGEPRSTFTVITIVATAVLSTGIFLLLGVCCGYVCRSIYRQKAEKILREVDKRKDAGTLNEKQIKHAQELAQDMIKKGQRIFVLSIVGMSVPWSLFMGGLFLILKYDMTQIKSGGRKF